jgi:hypothetical protein
MVVGTAPKSQLAALMVALCRRQTCLFVVNVKPSLANDGIAPRSSSLKHEIMSGQKLVMMSGCYNRK